MAKKSIVLTGENNKKAVLSLEHDGKDLSGRVRLYNFSAEPSGIISLGLYMNGRVVKAGLTRASSMLYTFQSLHEQLPNEFSCAVVNFTGGQSQALLYGSSDSANAQDQAYSAVINSLQGEMKASEVEKVLDGLDIDYDDELKCEIDKAIDEEFEKETCSKCKYRQYYYDHVKSETLGEGKVERLENIQPVTAHTFYDEIKDQVEKLFRENKTEEYLQNMIPDSKWIKVEYEESGDYYVLGLVYDDDDLKYVCYGVPGIYQKNPPRELSGYPVWFPLDKDKKEGFGYWLTYQDAESGQSVKAIVE